MKNNGKETGKKKNIFGKILMLAGAVSLLYGMAVIARIGVNHWFNYSFVILGAVLLLLGIFFQRIILWTKKKKSRKIFILCLCVLAGLVIINFSVFEIRIAKFAKSEPAENASWVIVLGAKVKKGNVPSLEYAVRLKTAADYINSCALSAKQNNASGKSSTCLIFTGGKGADEPAAEAEAGYDYITGIGALAVGNGPEDAISPDRVFLENRSTSTSENLINAMEIIKANGGSEKNSVVIISSSFHLYRASLLAEELGYENTSFLGATGLRLLIPYYYVREYAAYVREHL